MGKYFFAIILLFFTMNVYSQQQIEGFWNVKLGQSKSIVVSEVKRIYPNAKYGVTEYDNNDFIVDNPTIAGINLEKCNLCFTNGILSSAIFHTKHFSDFIGDSKDAQRYINNYLNNITAIYNRLVMAFKRKYGNPQYMLDNETVWTSANGNSIEITLRNQIQYVPYSGYLSLVGVYLTYKKGSHINDF